ncbi:DUF4041 domain-containing protein [Staphylococcus rostri]
MEQNIVNKWMIWTIFVTSLFSIATPGLAVFPTILSLILAIKYVILKKSYLPDYLKIQKLLTAVKDLEDKKARLENELSVLSQSIVIKQENLSELERQINEAEVVYDHKQLYPFDYDEVDSFKINNFIMKLNLKEKELSAFNNYYGNIPLNNKEKRFLKKQHSQMIRLFNAETSLILDKVSSKNFELSHKKIFNLYTSINKIFETDGVSLSENLLDIKLEKLSLIHKYQLKKEDEKEMRKEERARIQEENRVERELEKKLNQIDKDIKHHNNEINKLTKYLSKASSVIEKELFIEKINKLESQIEELNSSKSDIHERKINSKSGYVYIISNIGSFGENVYKIGVTRRLEPMERIKELSDASVPFEFDVHAIIFSDNAFELENKLHKHFKQNQINKVNNRKEFYNVDLSEIQKLVLAEYNDTVEFTFEPKATQYRESLLLS